jgi:pimeloyl-ACP methyl ester carboxylesterase
MGGYLCCAFAKAYPEKAKSITLINSLSTADLPARIEQRKRSLDLIKKHKSAYINMAITHLFNESEREDFKLQIEKMRGNASNLTIDAVVAAIKAMMLRPSYQRDLASLDIPICHIAGKNDEIVPLEQIMDDSTVLKSKLYAIDSGHMSILTHAEEISEIFKGIY